MESALYLDFLDTRTQMNKLLLSMTISSQSHPVLKSEDKHVWTRLALKIPDILGSPSAAISAQPFIIIARFA